MHIRPRHQANDDGAELHALMWVIEQLGGVMLATAVLTGRRIF